MNRPSRKLKHLEQKLADKQSRSRLKGAKAKRWKKSAEAYRPLLASVE